MCLTSKMELKCDRQCLSENVKVPAYSLIGEKNMNI